MAQRVNSETIFRSASKGLRTQRSQGDGGDVLGEDSFCFDKKKEKNRTA
jgi:hypothetical protein